ncbi:MAG: Gfo/Idh/MocA family oxidoreductase [Desulfatibacillaceae bacterium]|nr:Gfo/Idh/MocA family oxidoreductase [Desulfatibacillaceae bacterium]
MAKVRAAVIGTGYLGQFHAEKYAAHPDVELVGIVDTDLERAELIGKKCSCPFFTDHRQLLGRVDAASIVTPTGSHFDVSMDFLRAGSDVLIEKPITTTLAQADELIATANKAGRLIQVGLLERYNPAVLALAPLVTKPLFIEARRLSTFKTRALNVSVVVDLMIHDIDIIFSLVKSPIKSLAAGGASVVSRFADIANARIEFENGCVASLTASRMAQKDDRTLLVVQESGPIFVDFVNRSLTQLRPAGRQGAGDATDMEASSQTFEKADALAHEIDDFVKSVATRQQPMVCGRVGRDALKTAIDIMGAA